MQFLTIYRPYQPPSGTMPDPEHITPMRQFVEESFKSGALLSTGSFMPRANGANMRLINGKFDVEDAPASQEQVAGFAILETETDAELQNLVKRFLTLAGGGECEILRLNEFPQK